MTWGYQISSMLCSSPASSSCVRCGYGMLAQPVMTTFAFTSHCSPISCICASALLPAFHVSWMRTGASASGAKSMVISFRSCLASLTVPVSLCLVIFGSPVWLCPAFTGRCWLFLRFAVEDVSALVCLCVDDVGVCCWFAVQGYEFGFFCCVFRDAAVFAVSCVCDRVAGHFVQLLCVDNAASTDFGGFGVVLDNVIVHAGVHAYTVCSLVVRFD